MEEKIIWSGSASQWTNFRYYVICVPLSAVFGLGLFMALWRFLNTKYHIYEITNQRIIEHKGVLSKTTDELELYRVKDVRHEQPLWFRLVGLSTLVVYTTDKSNTLLHIKGVQNGKELKEALRIAIEERRDKKRVREVDFE
ncbi:MAG: PH domain-containing protein [Bacteroidota bacterium]|jgi:uncharacterized membrane protein YdbT with pleckstrin-like domain